MKRRDFLVRLTAMLAGLGGGLIPLPRPDDKGANVPATLRREYPFEWQVGDGPVWRRLEPATPDALADLAVPRRRT